MTNPATMWSEPDTALLRDRWEKGWTASEIRHDLPHFSRNAIIGKIDRLGLTRDRGERKPRKGQPSKPRPPRERKHNPGLAWIDGAKARKPELPIEPSDGVGLQLVDLTNSACRWPKGTPGVAGFCFCGESGADFSAGKPYCSPHARMAVI
ncbi:MAG: GcrA family cell cycle regulator [bacterium]|nr:GcrA family cell cycle regulator [bacterium]